MAAPALFHEYLLAHSQVAPTDPAVTNATTTWTHGELRERSRRYADQLHAHGLRAGDVVVLELQPCPEWVALMIAAASLGVVFVNLSPDMPAGRKDYIVGHVEARVHLRRGERPVAVPGPLGGAVDDAGVLRLAGELPARGERRSPAETDLAYVVFTSGSTGVPKGIMMSHRAVVTFWRGYSGFGVAPGVRLGSPAPPQFDFSLLDLGMALGNGGCLVQVPSLLLQQPAGLAGYLARKQVTQVNGVPSIWREMIRAGSADLLRQTAVDTVLFGGDSCPVATLRTLRAARPGLRLVQAFGHSESIACAYKVLPDPIPEIDGRVPFGTAAIEGMRMYLVDADGRVVDRPGVVGEVHIEGDCLFDGYWKDPDGTAKALVDSALTPGVRAFRSGDLAFFDADGEHYFLGRRDSQVQVHGYRVELEEIDLRLQGHPAVTQAATVLLDDDRPQLVAFVQPADHVAAVDDLAAALREHCGGVLPRYMVPARFELLDRMPLSPNGKVDRRSLAERLRERVP